MHAYLSKMKDLCNSVTKDLVKVLVDCLIYIYFILRCLKNVYFVVIIFCEEMSIRSVDDVCSRLYTL